MLSFVDAFANSSASVGLVLGGAVALVFTFIYYMMRDVLSFQEFTECIPEGFKSMIRPDPDPHDGLDAVRYDEPSWERKVFVADMVDKIRRLPARASFRW